MYVVTPYPNVAYALDLTKPGRRSSGGSGPTRTPAAHGVACCDVVNRGRAYADGKLIYNLLDAHTVARRRDKRQGVWRTKMGDVNRGETMTMAPLVVEQQGLRRRSSGGEMGVRGWIAALDVDTGKEVWRAYNTGPDTRCRSAPTSSPSTRRRARTSARRAGRPARGRRRRDRLGLDLLRPGANLIYHGTGNPGRGTGPAAGPQPVDRQRSSRATPTPAMAVGLPVHAARQVGLRRRQRERADRHAAGGATRKALVHFDRNGFAYTIDRAHRRGAGRPSRSCY